VPVILKIVKQITGMRFAAVARVTDQHWVTCATDDSLAFGLKPGDELPLESTICHEIRQHLQPVVFGDVGASEFCNHHTPQIYGLQSYVSIPIVLKDGKFFGTLCAIDSVPVELDPEDVVSKLALFSELIASNLELQSTLEASNHALVAAHEDASLQDEFVAVLSHDLRTPLSAIQMSADFLHRKLMIKKNVAMPRPF
jgi:GAF domain-containing protein